MNRLIIAKHLNEPEWLRFMKVIKEVENRFGVSIYHASPHDRKSTSDFNIGKLELCHKTRMDVRRLRNYIETMYNIAIYKMELAANNKSHLKTGGMINDYKIKERLREFAYSSSNEEAESE